MSPAAVAGVAAGVFAAGLAVGAGLSVAVDRVPERARDHKRSHPLRLFIAVMLLTGIGFLLAFLRFGLAARLPLACFFIAVMVVIAFIDWELQIIPDKISLPAAPIGLAAAIALNPGRWWVYLIAAAGSSLFLFMLALIWPNGMGGGDIKLALLMGGVLGATVIVAMFLAFLFGAVIGLILIATKLKTRKDAIPFGPYLALGSVLALLYGPWLVDVYLGLMR